MQVSTSRPHLQGFGFVLVVLVLGLFAVPDSESHAAEEWERVVDAARAQQDREIRPILKDAARMGALVTEYERRARAKPSAAAHYLHGRALFYAQRYKESQTALEQSLRVDTRFWFADRSLAQVALELNNIPLADRHTRRLLQRRPKDRQGRLLLALVYMGRQEWPQAASLIEAMRGQEPKNGRLISLLVTVYVQQQAYGKASALLGELLKTRAGDVALRDQYARLLAMGGEFKRAANQFERVLGEASNPVPTLSMLEICYARLEDWKKVERTLARLREVVKDPQERKRIDYLLAELKKGPPPTGPGEDEAAARDPLVKLHAECLDGDPMVRRVGLEKWFDAGIPFVPPTFLERLHDVEAEPDAQCRIRIVRLLGRIAFEGEGPEPLPNLGLALHTDPSDHVRRIAADELGRAPTDAVLVYLLPRMMDLPVSKLPSTPAARKVLVAEYNAIRRAARARASFRDLPPLAEDFVPEGDLAKNQAKWDAYLVSPEGQQVLKDAVVAFGRVPEPQPENYMHPFLFGQHSPLVIREAYRVLLQRTKSVQRSGEPVLIRRYADFPRRDPDAIGAGDLKALREALAAWWRRASGRG